MRVALALVLFAALTHAETGEDAWLRYQHHEGKAAQVTKLGEGPELDSAAKEIARALTNESVVLGTVTECRRAYPKVNFPADLQGDGYVITTVKRTVIVASPTTRGVLYGAFALIRRGGIGEETSNPAAVVRWVNQWDNLDGTIERGYGGRSNFFEGNHVLADLTRAGEYARLLASIGINGCTVNNVNANPRALTTEFLPQIARIADVFRPWGVRLSLSVDFASPKTIGGLDTFDPLDARVIAWWQAKADEIYKLIPDFAGFVLKADSEGRVGPSTYGRTHAQAANLLANAVKPHGGIVIYRGFVYAIMWIGGI